MTNTADPRKTALFPKFSWPRIHNPKLQFPKTEAELKRVADEEQRAIAQIKQAFLDNPDDIAAIVIEPIQGEGGDNHFRAEFHQALRQLADEHEALLIYDEVQSGLGITGHMWAYQGYGITPDIVCFGKKTQVCGIMVGPRIQEVENNVFVESSRLNSTWGGGLVDMVRAARYLEIIEEEQLVPNAAAVGAYLQEKLVALQNQFPQRFSNARGAGLMCAIDLSSTEARDEFHGKCLEHGLLVLKCGTHSLRFRPALTFSKEEVDEVVRIITSLLQ